MIERRTFLIGLTGLISTTFVRKAAAFSEREHRPLLKPLEAKTQTVLLYDYGKDDGWKWRLTLGPDIWPAPPPPTWRDFLSEKVKEGGRFITVEEKSRELGLELSTLNNRVPQRDWENDWQYYGSPEARAYSLLQSLAVGAPGDTAGLTAGMINFETTGGNPSDNSRWVDLRDDLSASLLQAWLLENGHPIELKIASD